MIKDQLTERYIRVIKDIVITNSKDSVTRSEPAVLISATLLVISAEIQEKLDELIQVIERDTS